MIHILSGIKELIHRQKQSERFISKAVGLARTTLRKICLPDELPHLAGVAKISAYFHHDVILATYPMHHDPENSTVATSIRVFQDGNSSWKIHLMNMVDEFRKTLDTRLLILPPSTVASPQIRALIAATTLQLCHEVDILAPTWATKFPALDEPWFLSEMESLKASSILESPYAFRSKNIFVLDNFLKRA